MVGDTGVLGLFGIRQERNLNDPLLFPLLPKSLDLAPEAGAKAHGRSEVVEVQDQDFWVLAGGWLQTALAGAGPRDRPADWRRRPAGRRWTSDRRCTPARSSRTSCAAAPRWSW